MGSVRRLVRWTGRVVAVVAGLVIVDVTVAAVRALCTPTARVVERRTRRRIAERRPFGEHARIVLVWTTVLGSRVLCRTRWFLRYLEGVSIRYGDLMDRPATPAELDRFIADYDIDVSVLDREPHAFTTVNELFSRPLRPGTRVIAQSDDPSVAVCPGDGRVSCVEVSGGGSVRVKGRNYDIGTLLGVRKRNGPAVDADPVIGDFHDTARADGFALAVLRLAPSDYHRVHFPVDGRWCREHALELSGEYHSVAPPCLGGPVDVLGRNRRSVLLVDSPAFGPVAIVLVGAVRVGSIELTAPSGDAVKGAELGRFRYGGSTVVVVFRRGTVRFDAELVRNTAAGMETLVQLGSVLGVATAQIG